MLAFLLLPRKPPHQWGIRMCLISSNVRKLTTAQPSWLLALCTTMSERAVLGRALKPAPTCPQPVSGQPVIGPPPSPPGGCPSPAYLPSMCPPTPNRIASLGSLPRLPHSDGHASNQHHPWSSFLRRLGYEGSAGSSPGQAIMDSGWAGQGPSFMTDCQVGSR